MNIHKNSNNIDVGDCDRTMVKLSVSFRVILPPRFECPLSVAVNKSVLSVVM